MNPTLLFSTMTLKLETRRIEAYLIVITMKKHNKPCVKFTDGPL